MKGYLRAGLEAGGMGFSSTWVRAHVDRAPSEDGPAPRHAAPESELVELSAVLADFPGTSLEMNPTAGLPAPWSVELMTKMSAAAHRAINWNLMMTKAGNIDGCREVLRASDGARRARRAASSPLRRHRTPHGVSLFSGYAFDLFPGGAST